MSILLKRDAILLFSSLSVSSHHERQRFVSVRLSVGKGRGM